MSPEEMYTEKELELYRMRQDAQSRATSGQLQRNSSAELLPSTGVGVPGGNTTPNPPAPDMERMAKDNAAAQSDLREQAPSIMTDDQQKMAAGAGGLALLGWLASKFMGGDDNNPPNNNKGPRSRDIRREPQMDRNIKGPQEPALLPEPKPAPAPAPQLPQATISGQPQAQMQYGQMTLNAPTGTPNPLPAGPVAPPAEVAPVAVQPKPIDPVVQARIDSIAAADRRKEALHQLELEEKKLRIEAAKQKSQGQPVSQYSNEEKQMNQRSQEAKVNKEIISVNKPKSTPTANVEKALVTAATQAAPIPEGAVPVPAKGAVAAVTTAANEISLPKEWSRKGMGWISSAYGIEGAQQFINQYNDGKPFKSHDEMEKVYKQVMTEPKFSTMPKDIRKERGIQKNPESQQYKIVPGGVVPPTLPSGGGGGGMVVPRGGVGNIPGANEQIHTLNPLKL